MNSTHDCLSKDFFRDYSWNIGPHQGASELNRLGNTESEHLPPSDSAYRQLMKQNGNRIAPVSSAAKGHPDDGGTRGAIC